MKEARRKKLGRRIAGLRAERGWSQQDLSDRVERSRSYISRLELGNVQEPQIGAVERIAECFGRDLTQLMDEAENIPLEDS